MADEFMADLPPDPAAAAPVTKAAGDMQEIGAAGLKVYSGVVYEEFLKDLTGQKGIRVYKTMAASDPVIKAFLRAIGLILRAVDWRVEPADDSPESIREKEFVESLLDDMSHTWEDFISEVVSMLVYGWAYHEIVLKRRIGPTEANPSRRSKYVDGRIGIRKLAPRSQDTLLRWEMQDDGGVAGMTQLPPTLARQITIPIERALLFRTESVKNNPEGESVLRGAYESWYHARAIRNAESIGIERELAGLPVISIPAKYLAATASAEDQAIRATYEKVARDLKFNEQGGLVVPSNTYVDSDGKFTSIPMVEIKLLSSGGRRQIDTNAVVGRHQRDMARSVLAEFLMLGADAKGSFALSKDKTDFFMRACSAFIGQVAAPLNRFLLPRLWDYNGLDRALMPSVVPGKLDAVDLSVLGTFIQQLAAAGAPLFPNDELLAFLCDVADLPEPVADPGLTPGRGNLPMPPKPRDPARPAPGGAQPAAAGPDNQDLQDGATGAT